jgi:uncharacterized delta-60 repeat protein
MQRRFRLALAGAVSAIALVAGAAPALAAPSDFDTAFGDGGEVVTAEVAGIKLLVAYDTLVQADGKTVVVGAAQDERDFSRTQFIARYNADGSLDTTFASGDGVAFPRVPTQAPGPDRQAPSDLGARAVVRQADGKYVLVGGTGTEFPLTTAGTVTRVDENGALDTGFGDGGFVNSNDIRGGLDVGQLSDGSLVVMGGRGPEFDTGLLRLDADGTLVDQETYGEFFPGGLTTSGQRVFVTGGSGGSGGKLVVAAFTSDLTPDASFGDGGFVRTGFEGNNSSGGSAVLLQPDGRIVVLGSASDVAEDNFTSSNHRVVLARLLSTGALDPSFDGDGRAALPVVDYGPVALAAQPDGKLVVSADNFRVRETLIARVNTDGTLDAGFSPDGCGLRFFQDTGEPAALAVGPDGRITSASTAAVPNQRGAPRLVRLLGGPSIASPPACGSPDPGPGPDPAPGPAPQPPTDGGGTPPPSGGGQPVAPGGSAAPESTRPSPGEAGWRWSPKLRVSRAQVLRSERLLDVLAPITSRASGQVDVAFRAAGRTTSFTAPITDGPVTLDQVRFREAIPREQADLGTGIVTLSYPGDGDTRPTEVRLRAARNAADLEVERLSLQGDRLQANGTLTDRARGVVRLEFSYIDAQGLAQTWKANTEIQEGEWSLDGQVPPDLATYGGYLSVLYTGNYDRRIRGEMTAYDLRPGLVRTP